MSIGSTADELAAAIARITATLRVANADRNRWLMMASLLFWTRKGQVKKVDSQSHRPAGYSSSVNKECSRLARMIDIGIRVRDRIWPVFCGVKAATA